MTYTPTNWVDGATPLNRANMMRIENELALLDPLLTKTVPLSTTIPASPVDGQEVILVDSVTVPQWHWHMRFVAAYGYWIYLGGQPIVGWYVTSQAMPGTWAAYNPTVFVPFNGIYTFSGQGLFQNSSAVGLNGVSAWYNGTYDNDFQGLIQGNVGYNTVKTDTIGKAFTAGQAISLAAYTNVPTALTLARVGVTPVRVNLP